MTYFKLVPELSITEEVISCISFLFFSVIASAGGVGGGGIYTSVLIAFGSIVHTAIPLSKLVIFTGSFILFMFNFWRKTDENTPLIAWDLVFLTENMVVLGAILGAMLNGVLPQWALLILELIFLIYQAITMIQKGVKKLKIDLKAIKQAKIDENERHDIIPAEEFSIDQPLISDASEISLAVPAEKPHRLSHFKHISATRMANFLFCYVVSLGLTLGRSFVPTCGGSYWALLVLNVAVSAGCTLLNIWMTQKAVQRGEEILLNAPIRPPFHPWHFYGKFSLVSILAGVIAAGFGLGGGLVKNPLFMSMGVPALATRNTSGAMIVFTSLTGIIEYYVQGQIDMEYSWVFMLMLAVGFPSGYFLSNHVIKLVKSTAVIQLAMGATMVISSIGILVQVVKEIIQMVQTGTVPGLRDLCTS